VQNSNCKLIEFTNGVYNSDYKTQRSDSELTNYISEIHNKASKRANSFVNYTFSEKNIASPIVKIEFLHRRMEYIFWEIEFMIAGTAFL